MNLNTFGQFFRFIFVGIASNAVLYLLYIVATSIGIEHKLAMTGLFVLGAIQTFVINKSWSFKHRGQRRSALLRYLFVYVLAYVLNLSVMLELVDRLGYSDRVVQGIMIIIVAMFLFVAQKLWVFRTEKNSSRMESL